MCLKYLGYYYKYYYEHFLGLGLKEYLGYYSKYYYELLWLLQYYYDEGCCSESIAEVLAKSPSNLNRTISWKLAKVWVRLENLKFLALFMYIYICNTNELMNNHTHIHIYRIMYIHIQSTVCTCYNTWQLHVQGYLPQLPDTRGSPLKFYLEAQGT